MELITKAFKFIAYTKYNNKCLFLSQCWSSFELRRMVEPIPVQVAVDKRFCGPERNSEKEWMRRNRRVVVKVPSSSEQSNPTALVSVGS